MPKANTDSGNNTAFPNLDSAMLSISSVCQDAQNISGDSRSQFKALYQLPGFFERAWEVGDMFVARQLGNIYLKNRLGVI